MATRRTIVGSHPHRRTLPMGREAIERALAMCRRWGTAWWLPDQLGHASIAELEAMLAKYPVPARTR